MLRRLFVFFFQKEVAPQPSRGSPAIGLGVKMTLTRTAFDLGEDRGYKLYRRTRGGVLSECPRVQMAPLAPGRVGYLSYGSLSLTAVLFGSYQGENDHYNSEAFPQKPWGAREDFSFFFFLFLLRFSESDLNLSCVYSLRTVGAKSFASIIFKIYIFLYMYV